MVLRLGYCSNSIVEEKSAFRNDTCTSSPGEVYIVLLLLDKDTGFLIVGVRRTFRKISFTTSVVLV